MNQWTKFTEILSIFKIPFEATNTIQKASYTLTDFFACWLRIEYKLDGLLMNQNMVTDLASTFRQKLDARKQDLFRYPTMMSAIYLDPRVRGEIVSSDELMIAKYKLEELYKRNQEMKEENGDKNAQQDCHLVANQSFEDSFERYLASRAANNSNNNQPASGSRPNEEPFNFFLLLENFEKSSVYQATPVLAYWESQKEIHPELYELACMINSIPPSQATVERSFSILKFIFTCKRHKLKANILEDILMMKLNESMMKFINKQDIDAILN